MRQAWSLYFLGNKKVIRAESLGPSSGTAVFDRLQRFS